MQVPVDADLTASRYRNAEQGHSARLQTHGRLRTRQREHQARYRACYRAETTPPITQRRRPPDRRNCPQRSHGALRTLPALQAQYADWLAALTRSSTDSMTADALEAIIGLDLTSFVRHRTAMRIRPSLSENRPTAPTPLNKQLDRNNPNQRELLVPKTV